MATERKIIRDLLACNGQTSRCHECPYRRLPDDGKCFERLLKAAVTEIREYEKVLAEQRKEYMAMERDLEIAQQLVVKDCSTCESRTSMRNCYGCDNHAHWRCKQSFKATRAKRNV